MKRKKLPLSLLMIRGSIGKQFCIKHYRWGVIKTKFPDMSNIVASAEQCQCRNLFKEAVAYAKTVIADPVLKREWQKKIRRRNGVYNKAIKAYMLSKQADILKARKDRAFRVAFKNKEANPSYKFKHPAWTLFTKTANNEWLSRTINDVEIVRAEYG